MFCTECGQQMADEAKFCAFCGTRRALPVSGNEAQVAAPPKPEPPAMNPPSPVRTIRSTAEIMPMRVRPAAPRPPVEEHARTGCRMARGRKRSPANVRAGATRGGASPASAGATSAQSSGDTALQLRSTR